MQHICSILNPRVTQAGARGGGSKSQAWDDRPGRYSGEAQALNFQKASATPTQHTAAEFGINSNRLVLTPGR